MFPLILSHLLRKPKQILLLFSPYPFRQILWWSSFSKSDLLTGNAHSVSLFVFYYYSTSLDPPEKKHQNDIFILRRKHSHTLLLQNSLLFLAKSNSKKNTHIQNIDTTALLILHPGLKKEKKWKWTKLKMMRCNDERKTHKHG